MRIVGIDPALTVTGYGVIESEKNQLALVEAGIIKTSASQPLPERLNKIHAATIKLIGDSHPNVLVLEKLYAHYKHPVTAYILGQALCVISFAFSIKDIPVVEYAATSVKTSITGWGLASKYQVQRMVAGILDLNTLPKYTDVTDALALAIAHSYIMRVRI